MAEVKAACKALGISTTGKREALLRRLALHERWAEVSASPLSLWLHQTALRPLTCVRLRAGGPV